MGNPLVSIVIPNYNGAKFLPECLSSLMVSDYKNFEVLVVDDGSTDNSLQVLAPITKSDDRIKLLRNPKNLGASASRNHALKFVLGEIIFFLDNDTRVEKDTLSRLISPLIKPNSSLGATCSKTLVYQKPDIISTAGLLLIPHTGWGIARGGGEPDKSAVWNRPAKTVAISAALAVKKKVVDQIGGFDAKLAVHTEDLDFCWRIWLAGYEILYVPASRVYHWSKSVEQRTSLMRATKSFVYFHINKNTFRTLLKNYSLPFLAKYLPFSLAIVFGRGLIVLFSRLDPSALIAAFRSVFWNLRYLPDTLRCRRVIQSSRRFSDAYLYRTIMSHESLWEIYTRHF